MGHDHQKIRAHAHITKFQLSRHSKKSQLVHNFCALRTQHKRRRVCVFTYSPEKKDQSLVQCKLSAFVYVCVCVYVRTVIWQRTHPGKCTHTDDDEYVCVRAYRGKTETIYHNNPTILTDYVCFAPFSMGFSRFSYFVHLLSEREESV